MKRDLSLFERIESAAVAALHLPGRSLDPGHEAFARQIEGSDPVHVEVHVSDYATEERPALKATIVTYTTLVVAAFSAWLLAGCPS